MISLPRKRFLKLLFWIIIVNFIAQIPYYFHQYYLTNKLLPSVVGVLLMTTVLVWFLIGYYGLLNRKPFGYVVTQSFLVVEFLFYLQTQIVQALSGKGIFLHVLHPDGIVLFIVFGIGYINFLMAPWFIFKLAQLHRLKATARS